MYIGRRFGSDHDALEWSRVDSSASSRELALIVLGPCACYGQRCVLLSCTGSSPVSESDLHL